MRPLILADPEYRPHHPGCECNSCRAARDPDKLTWSTMRLTEKQYGEMHDALHQGLDGWSTTDVIFEMRAGKPWLKLTNNTADYIVDCKDRAGWGTAMEPWEIAFYRRFYRKLMEHLEYEGLTFNEKEHRIEHIKGETK